MIGFLCIALFIFFIIINVPICVSMGLAAAIAIAIMEIPGQVIIQRMISGIESWSMLAVPFYILAANIMNAGGISHRLFEFADKSVGWIKGGLAHANVLASMIFAGISGAAVADASGLGKVEIEVMTEAGYDKGFAVGVTAASCMLGPIIPPSIMLIIYGHIAEVSIAALWVAGIFPGILAGIILMIYIYISVARGKVYAPKSHKFSFKEFKKSFLNNFFVILLPFILLGTILSGMATPTETGVIACVYIFILSVIYNGKSFFKQLPSVLLNSVKTSSIIMFIVATATALVWVITTEGTAVILSRALLSISENKYIILLIINAALLFCGAILEQIPAMLIIVPMLTPLAEIIGINPIHLGIVVVFNLMIGMITPPMGMALYIMAAISDVPMKAIIGQSMRFFLALVLALLLITYLPFISLALPKWLNLLI